MHVRGDGLIVATPTGSSAYNLSAGGPLISFDAPVIAVTPVCSHERTVRSLVISDRQVIRISRNHDTPAGIYVDGKKAGLMAEDILIRKSDKVLRLLQKKVK